MQIEPISSYHILEFPNMAVRLKYRNLNTDIVGNVRLQSIFWYATRLYFKLKFNEPAKYKSGQLTKP